MLLLVADHYPNQSITPAPQFFDGDQLTDVHLPSTGVLQLTQLPTSAPATFQLEVLLRPDTGPTPPIAALILTSQELAWLRHLLYLLPAEAFRDYTLYQGEELSVLLGNNRPIERLPFGIPLRRPGDRTLFIPLRSRFVPDLPWVLLQEVLTLKDGIYTFLTPDYRLDLSATLFAPLTRVLVAEQKRPRVNVRMLAPSSLPTLTWTSLPEPPTETIPDTTKKDQTIGGRILSGLQTVIGGPTTPPSTPTRETSITPPPTPTGGAIHTPPPTPTRRTSITPLPTPTGGAIHTPPPTPTRGATAIPPQNARLDENTLWREKARACEESKDFLAAAVCYNFLNDVVNSARCYRQAATQLKMKERKEE
jgi:hypothetical protein